MTILDPQHLSQFAVSHLNVGVLVVDKDYRVMLWNDFMSSNSGRPAEAVLGRSLFESFPDLPKKWLAKKIDGVFLLGNYAFTSWDQRAHVFEFANQLPVTGGLKLMSQNVSFIPIKDEAGLVQAVCINVQDVSDVHARDQQLKQVMAELEEQSRIDGLTKLYNRRYWEECLAKEFTRAQRYGGGFSLIMFDLDHFKLINDTYGHIAGDQVLSVVSDLLANALRDHDVAGRYGGEEFGVILPNTNAAGAIAVAERIGKTVEQAKIVVDGQDVFATVSLGVSVYSECSPRVERYEEIIDQADRALYRSKQAGRNCWTLFKDGSTRMQVSA